MRLMENVYFSGYASTAAAAAATPTATATAPFNFGINPDYIVQFFFFIRCQHPWLLIGLGFLA
jgi:hypothetical protein